MRNSAIVAKLANYRRLIGFFVFHRNEYVEYENEKKKKKTSKMKSGNDKI